MPIGHCRVYPPPGRRRSPSPPCAALRGIGAHLPSFLPASPPCVLSPHRHVLPVVHPRVLGPGERSPCVPQRRHSHQGGARCGTSIYDTLISRFLKRSLRRDELYPLPLSCAVQGRSFASSWPAPPMDHGTVAGAVATQAPPCPATVVPASKPGLISHDEVRALEV